MSSVHGVGSRASRGRPVGPRDPPRPPRQGALRRELGQLQLAVQPEDPPPHGEGVKARQEAQQRIDDAEQRDQQEQRALGERGPAGREVPLEERAARLVVLPRVLAEGQVDRLGGRELTGTVKQARSRVNLRRGLEEQVLERGVQILAHDEASLRSQQTTSLDGTLRRGRPLPGAGPACRVRIQGHVRVGPGYDPSSTSGAARSCWTTGASHDVRIAARSDPAPDKRVRGLLGRQGQQLGEALVDAAEGKQPLGQRPGAAALRADRETLAP